jgi:hypothetical protein
VPSMACAAITKLGHRVLSVCLANYTLGWTVQFFRSPSLPFSLCWANCRYFGHQVTITPRLISSEDQVNVCKSTLGPHLSKRWLTYCHIAHTRGSLLGSASHLGGVLCCHVAQYRGGYFGFAS